MSSSELKDCQYNSLHIIRKSNIELNNIYNIKSITINEKY